MSEKPDKSIKVNIAGRFYPLKVSTNEESLVKDVANEVNDKVKAFQMSYTNKDQQDCLSMALLTYAVDYYKNDSSTEGKVSPMLKTKLDKLDTLLDNALTE